MQKFHKYFYFVLENDSNEEKIGGTANNLFFIAMDLTNFSYKVFNDHILLVRQVDFSEEIRKYGVPVQVSSDGRNYIFVNALDKTTLHILTLTPHKFIYHKTIKIRESIMNYAKVIDQKKNKDVLVPKITELLNKNFSE